MNLRSKSLSCIFDALFGDTPFGHIFFAYAHLAKYGHMGIRAYAKKNMAKWGEKSMNFALLTLQSWENVPSWWIIFPADSFASVCPTGFCQFPRRGAGQSLLFAGRPFFPRGGAGRPSQNLGDF